MSNKYQKMLDGILSEDFTLMSKLYLLYELISFFDAEYISDELIDQIYQAYIDNGNYNSIYAYVLAITDWCDVNETEFARIEDYGKMLSELL